LLYFKNKKNLFWGIHQEPQCSGKTIGWIKAKKGLAGKRNVFLVFIKHHQFPHPTGNALIPKGLMVNHLAFDSLQEAKNFANAIITQREENA
tara:strand:- start:136 stop:411 length:276 start_codon:yes stop_codon:yes gene_type:complete